MNRTILFFALWLMASTLPAAGNVPVADTTAGFRYGKLENGFTYYIRHTSLEPGFADFYLVQNVGALMEEDNQNGLAHLLEHMAFNGSESFPQGIPAFLKRRGITQFNAYTGQNETVYHVDRVPTSDAGLVDSCLLIVRDWSGFLLLDPVEIDKERGVILEERRTRRNLQTQLQEQVAPYMYNYSKYATHNVIGLPEVIKNSTPKELRDYYHDFYRPDQQAAIIVGDIDARAVEADIRRLFGAIPKRVNPKPRLTYDIPDNAEPFYYKAIHKELPSNGMTLMKRVKDTPPASLEEMMRDNLLRRFFNDLIAARLQQLVVTGKPAFLQTSLSYGGLVRGYSTLTVTMNSFPGKEKEALRQVFSELERMYRNGVTEEELGEQTGSFLRNLDESTEDQFPNSAYVELYQQAFLEKKPVTTVKEDRELSRKVVSELRPADLQAWMKHWYEGNRNWLFIMQGNNPDYVYPAQDEIMAILHEVRQTGFTQRDTTIRVIPLMDFEVAGGKIVKEQRVKAVDAEKWTLSNGCTVYYKYNNGNGAKIDIFGESAGGTSLLAAGDLPSADALNSLMLQNGIYRHDSQMLQALLKGRRVNVGMKLGADKEIVNGFCDTGNTETLFQLLYLMFEKPRFSRDEFDKFVYMNRMEYNNRPRTAMDSVSEELRRLRVKDSPRLWKPDDKYYDAMSFDRMVAIYKDRFRDASDFTFYLVGDISREEAQKWVARYLGALPSEHRAEKAVSYDFSRSGSLTRTIEANIPDHKYMVNIEFTNHLPLKRPDEFTLSVLQMILQDRYHNSIRESEGGSYGVKVMATAIPQRISVRFESSLEKGDRMRAIVHEEIRRLVADGVTEEEVTDQLLRIGKGLSEPRDNQSNAHWLDRVHYYVEVGRLPETPEEALKMAGKVTPAKVQALASKFFGSAECVDLVVKSKE